MLVAPFLLAYLVGQAPADPFAGTGCNCTTFCAGKCAVNATGAANMTLYRMTPYGKASFSFS